MTPHMRVLHVIDNLCPGGTERQCVELVRSMVGRGVETAVFYFRPGALVAELEGLGVTVRPAPPVRFRSPGAPIQLIRLARTIAEWAPDVIQTYGFYSNVPGILAAFLARVPVRVAGRRELARYFGRAQRSTDRWAWRLAQRIVVNSEAVRQQLIHQEGIAPNKVVVIRNGLDIGQWPAPHPYPDGPDGAVVGMVAHFRPQKDHFTFLRAAREILQAMPSVRFCLVGSGDLEGLIRESAARSGIASQVDFLVGLEGEAVRAAVAKFRISVLSSKDNEGLPNAVLEAMAAGLPVVATTVGGTPEIIEDGETGFLVPAGDPALLAARVLGLLKEPSLARAMGERARRKVEREFTVDRMAGQFLGLYRGLLADKLGRGR